MSKTIAEIASDPSQYDNDELIWTTEGSKDNFNRKLYLAVLRPMLETIDRKSVIDIGCGQGWLCDEISRHGGVPVGIDPSLKNIELAHDTYPELELVRSSLQEFETDKQFDVVTAVMVLEHFLNFRKAFEKIAGLLKPDGKFIIICGDFNKFTDTHGNYPFEKVVLQAGEVATHVDYGERAGVMCSIIRTVELYTKTARLAGFRLQSHRPILPFPGHPRYNTHKGRALFHLLVLTK